MSSSSFALFRVSQFSGDFLSEHTSSLAIKDGYLVIQSNLEAGAYKLIIKVFHSKH